MSNRKRLKRWGRRWIPQLSFMDIYVTTPIMLLFGLLIITGQSVVYGIEGGELYTIPFPKSPTVGWVIILLTLSRLFPPVINYRIKKGFKILVADIKSRFKVKKDIQSRIDQFQGDK